jgi:pyruvate dehydrogenase E1 component
MPSGSSSFRPDCSQAQADISLAPRGAATLDYLATIHRVPSISLGVTRFGQAGSLEDVYRYHCIDTDSIVRAGLDAASQTTGR